MNTYTTTHRAACPNGDLMDTYQITIRSESTIMVEDIISTLKNAPNPIFQEALADHLRNVLGAEIIVSGTHHGIEIESYRK